MEPSKDKQIQFRGPESLYRALRDAAEREERPVSYIIRRAVEAELRRLGLAS